ncbi:hypothetical protein [Methylomonas methanica]|uniref:hypothetical protein n=1 Tax=Methylomonas methanica TaxID=421 RepID=UPI00059D76FC|nr:hypothetical protein [Methylomonas methanica]
MVFALTGQPLAVQIRSRRICALPKESIRRKGNPDAALILRTEGFERGFPKGLPSPHEKRDASLHRPCGLIRSNPAVLGITGENPTEKLPMPPKL